MGRKWILAGVLAVLGAASACGSSGDGADSSSGTGTESSSGTGAESECNEPLAPVSTDPSDQILSQLDQTGPEFTYLVDLDGDGSGICVPFLPTSGFLALRSSQEVIDNGVTFNWGPAVLGEFDIQLDDLGAATGLWTAVDVGRISQTRAIDGTQTSADGRCTWTYHPDSGLSIVCSTEDALV